MITTLSLNFKSPFRCFLTLGTTVTIQFDDDENDLETYQIVGKQEVNVDDNKISFVSPIGKAIMHKKVGHTATVIAPAGSYTVKIISISI